MYLSNLLPLPLDEKGYFVIMHLVHENDHHQIHDVDACDHLRGLPQVNLHADDRLYSDVHDEGNN